MSQGTATGTATSAELLASSRYRESITFTMTDATATASFGFSTAAVAGEGLELFRVGDSFTVCCELARSQINIIGNGAVVSYQTGNVRQVVRGPNPLPSS